METDIQHGVIYCNIISDKSARKYSQVSLGKLGASSSIVLEKVPVGNLIPYLHMGVCSLPVC